MVAMPDDGRRAENRARRAKQFQDIEASLARAADAIEQSQREVARSRQIMKDADAADAQADKERDDARWT